MSDIQTIFEQLDPKRLLAALLLAPDGNVVAQHSIRGLDEATQQAPYNIATRVLNYPTGLAALETLKESVFYDMDGRRLICRLVLTSGNPHLLIILTPANATYRRALDQLIKQIASPSP